MSLLTFCLLPRPGARVTGSLKCLEPSCWDPGTLWLLRVFRTASWRPVAGLREADSIKAQNSSLPLRQHAHYAFPQQDLSLESEAVPM